MEDDNILWIWEVGEEAVVTYLDIFSEEIRVILPISTSWVINVYRKVIISSIGSTTEFLNIIEVNFVLLRVSL
jgi:hypothetical protein